MAVTTDLTTVLDFDGTNPTSYTEFTGYTAGSKQASDTDFPIQGTTHASGECRTAALASVALTHTAVNYVTDGHIFVWGTFLAPAAIDTFANGGLVLGIGDSASTWKGWIVGGRDYGRYPFGGWACYVARDTFTTDDGNGTPGTTSFAAVGMAYNITSAIAKGSPMGVDAVRYGLGELRVNGTEDFDSMEATANSSTNRWGLFQNAFGSYLWKGQMILGYTSALTMTAANRVIAVEDVRKVNADFNRIEFYNTGSVIDWTAISISALGTVSRGSLEMVDQCDLAFTSCTFTDMSTFAFSKGTTKTVDITSTVFRRCDTVTQGGSTMLGCTFDNSTSTTAFLVSDVPDEINSCTFIGDATTTPGHAVDFGTVTGGTASVPVTINWDSTLDNGANQSTWEGSTVAATTGTLGTSGASAISIDVPSGSYVKIAVGDGTVPTVYKTGAGEISVTANEVTLTITVVDIDTGSPLEGAMVYAYASDLSTTFVDKVETNASGQVSWTGSLGAAKTLAGRVRAASPADKAYTKYYKTSPLSGTVSNTADTDITVQLIPD